MKYLFTFLIAIMTISCANNYSFPIIPTEANRTKSIIEDQGKSVVLVGVYNQKGKLIKFGSGFFISKDGQIATNYHVIENGYGVVVKSLNKKKYDDVYLLSFDRDRDIAILKVNETNSFQAKIGNSDIVKQGEKAITIGNPEGFQNTVSDGIVSGIREIDGIKLFQITCPISEGSSGGPLYNLDGEVIGITTLMSKIGQNLNFAVPINYLLSLQKNAQKISIKEKFAADQKKSFSEYIERQKKSSKFDGDDSLFDEAYKLYDKAIKKVLPPAPAPAAPKTSNVEAPPPDTDTVAAIELLKQAIDINPYYHAAYLVLGVLYATVYDYDKAEQNYLKSIELKPKYQEGYIELAKTYDASKRYDIAKKYYNEALRIGPPSSSIHESLGNIYLKQEDFAEAEKSFKKMLDFEDAAYGAHEKLADLYLKKGDLKSSCLHLNKTLPFESEQDLPKRISLYKKYLDANNFYAHISVGYIYYFSDKYDGAIEHFEKALKLNEKEFNKFYELAYSYENKANYEKAIIFYEKILTANPMHYLANLHLGIIYNIDPDLVKLYENLYKIKPNYKKSIRLLSKARDISPNIFPPHFNLGLAYYYTKEYHEALREAKRAVEIKPNFPSLFQLGEVYLALKENANALENYDKAQKLHSTPFNIYQIADRFIELKEYDKAISVLNEGIDKYKGEENKYWLAEFNSSIAKIYSRKKEYQTSIQYYQESLKNMPKHFDAVFGIAGCYFELKNYDEAEHWWKKAAEINPKSAAAFYNIGLVNVNRGECKTANFYFKKSLEIDPSNADADKMIKICQLEIDKIDFPNKLQELSARQDNVGILARIMIIVEEYNQANDIWIGGMKETTPVYKDGYQEKYVSEYRVSPKIYEAQGRFEKIKAEINTFEPTKGRLKEALKLISHATEQRNSGIDQHSKGFYISKKDYSGEFEKGRAKIDLANTYFLDGLKIIYSEVKKYRSTFGVIAEQSLENSINYYQKK